MTMCVVWQMNFNIILKIIISGNIKLKYFNVFLSITIYYNHKVANVITIIPD